ncbi:hypothetical protein A2V82_00140 [candidate division KSB1 bacterium RBG_16_48_16]|nr:MAG: hypothetical protein A2V82_00140 [candidate division KSB1 bacterium RBG_16_48_16]
MRKTPTKTLGQSIEYLLAELGIDRKVKACRVMQLWPQIVGEKIDQVTKPIKVQDKILFIKVQSATWKTELFFHRQEILQKIKKDVGDDIIEDIRLF